VEKQVGKKVVAIYGSVSSAENKSDLESQAERLLGSLPTVPPKAINGQRCATAATETIVKELEAHDATR
jgi:predicted site-specific integrase-resolvase